MTAPRQVLPGTTYLVTRRCFQRQFLLRPSPETNAIFLYVLAVAAQRFGVQVHAFCVLSNHFHLVVTDPGARLPAFEQYLDSLVARAINSMLGRWESFWGPSSYSAVALLTPEDIVDKAAYTLANPTAAGLVSHGREWPGLWSSPEKIGAGPIQVSKPAAFFRANGPMPDTIEIVLTAPPTFASLIEFRDQLQSALAVHEQRATIAVASASRQFLGPQGVIAQEPTARPASGEPHRQLSPRIASRDKWKRIEALTRLKDFLTTYREAWQALRNGVRDALFPFGTYWLRVALGVRCAAPG